MSFYGNRRPRGFRHLPIYYDERKELVRKIEERARQEKGRGTHADPGHDDLHSVFLKASGGLRGSREAERPGGRYPGLGAVIVLAVVLVAVWCMLNR